MKVIEKILYPAVLLACVSVQAGLHLNTRYLRLEKNPTGFIELWNSGSDTLYIQVDAFKYTVNKEQNQVEYTSQDPKKFGLLYTPRKLVIQPGKKKRMRVTALEKVHGDEHQYYNLKYNVLKKKPELIDHERKEMSASISIGILYQTMVDVGAAEYRYDTKSTYDKKNQHMIIENTGNAIINLGPFYNCTAKEVCKKNNMYTSLVPKKVFKYRFSENDNNTALLKYGINSYHGKTVKTAKARLDR